MHSYVILFIKNNLQSSATLLKSHFGMGIFVQICCIFSEHLFLKTPLEGCFCIMLRLLKLPCVQRQYIALFRQIISGSRERILMFLFLLFLSLNAVALEKLRRLYYSTWNVTLPWYSQNRNYQKIYKTITAGEKNDFQRKRKTKYKSESYYEKLFKEMEARKKIVFSSSKMFAEERTEVALQRCSYKKVFWNYAANLQVNTHAEVWFL